MNTKYLPITLDYLELIEKTIKEDTIRVFYFGFDNYPNLEEASGKATSIVKDEDNSYFLIFDNNTRVRLDRIVVFNGIPGPAYDEYDAYALAPLTCKAGYDEDC